MPTYPEWVTNNKYTIQIFISEYHILYHRTTACIENKTVNNHHKLPLSNAIQYLTQFLMIGIILGKSLTLLGFFWDSLIILIIITIIIKNIININNNNNNK